jgi:Mrp family chromosome partitioning ATPase/DUF971 family protein
MPTESDILNALRGIIDPDFNKDIVSLGFVKNIKIAGDRVSLDIELTTPACPVKDQFRQQAEEAVTSIEGIAQACVTMTSLKRPQPASYNAQSSLQHVQSIIAISSCKGGVGKSTMAAHLAVELASRGFKVGLVDTDIYGPSIPALFSIHQVTLIANARRQFIPIEKNGLKIMSFGFLIGDAPAVMRGPIVSQYIQQILHNTDWGELDYLFIDMPPGTGDVQLTITQTAPLNGAVIVTTPQTLSLIDVTRGILMFEKVNVPILGLIENMSYFRCDHCQHKHYVFGEKTSRSLNERFGIELLAEFPLTQQMALPIEESKGHDLVRQAADKVVMALGKSSINQKQIPEIKMTPTSITLSWTNGDTVTVSNRELRLSCQCALCVNEITGEQQFKEENIKQDIAAKEVIPLGNYAIGITWNDGHSSGIYPYKNIKEIAKVVNSK